MQVNEGFTNNCQQMKLDIPTRLNENLGEFLTKLTHAENISWINLIISIEQEYLPILSKDEINK